MKDVVLRKMQHKLQLLDKRYDEVREALKEESKDSRDDNLILIQKLITEQVDLEVEMDRLRSQISQMEALTKSKSIVYQIDLNGVNKEISIVMPDFADPAVGFISEESPLAQALKNKKDGENFEYATPVGNKSGKVISVLYK